MSIADKLSYLNGTKEAIKQAIIDKGVEVSDTDTFRSYADKIASITQGGGIVDTDGDWHPNPLWWDIETILNNDTRDYAGKYISLIPNIDDSIIFSLSSDKCVAVATSDGAFYSYDEDGSEITHTWDKTYDKPVSNDDDEQLYTRYAIYYHNNETVTVGSIQAPKTNMYVVFKCNLTNGTGSFNNSWFHSQPLLQSFKFLDEYNFVNSINFGNFCQYCYQLVNIPENLDTNNTTNFSNFCHSDGCLTKLPENLDTSNGTNFQRFLSSCSAIKELPENLDTSKATNLQYFCQLCERLSKLPKNMNTSSCTGFGNFCTSCLALIELPNGMDLSKAAAFSGFLSNTSSVIKANIKLPKVSLSLSKYPYILKSSLQYMADNAPDVTDLSTSPILTLGEDNIARAGGADGDIIQTLVNKGWTVN